MNGPSRVCEVLCRGAVSGHTSSQCRASHHCCDVAIKRLEAGPWFDAKFTGEGVRQPRQMDCLGRVEQTKDGDSPGYMSGSTASGPADI